MKVVIVRSFPALQVVMPPALPATAVFVVIAFAVVVGTLVGVVTPFAGGAAPPAPAEPPASVVIVLLAGGAADGAVGARGGVVAAGGALVVGPRIFLVEVVVDDKAAAAASIHLQPCFICALPGIAETGDRLQGMPANH